MKSLPLMLVLAAVTLQAGCVVGRRTIDIPVTAVAPAPSVTRGAVYVGTVTDDRKFENKPADPSIPSVDGDVTKISAAQKDQMIGRQRNGFGHAMGDIGLPNGDSVTKKVRLLVAQSLRQDGYRVVDDPQAPNKIAVSVNEFWAWMTPGFVALTFEAKISCTLDVSAGGARHVVIVHGYGLNHGQVAKDGNWQEAFAPAFDDFGKNLNAEIDKLGLTATAKN
jgi:uncharacterized lipoprotein YajG